jgi:hypothetical protein
MAVRLSSQASQHLILATIRMLSAGLTNYSAVQIYEDRRYGPEWATFQPYPEQCSYKRIVFFRSLQAGGPQFLPATAKPSWSSGSFLRNKTVRRPFAVPIWERTAARVSRVSTGCLQSCNGLSLIIHVTKLRGLIPRENWTGRATAACRRS